MSDLRKRFKSCGKDVHIAEDVRIAHPESLEVGDHVTFMRGFEMCDALKVCRIGSNVTFYPNCFIQGTGELLIADQVHFFPNAYLSTGHTDQSLIQIGSRTHFAPGCVLYGHGGLRIGPDVNVAAHVVLATAGHKYQVTDIPMSQSGTLAAPIQIDEDVWLGANVTVTAGTHIARGCVIGANAVVTKDTQSMGIYMGVPAQRVRDRGTC